MYVFYFKGIYFLNTVLLERNDYFVIIIIVTNFIKKTY